MICLSYTVENIIIFFSSIPPSHCNNEIETNKISLKLTPPPKKKLYIQSKILKPRVCLKELFSKEMCVGEGGNSIFFELLDVAYSEDISKLNTQLIFYNKIIEQHLPFH